MTFCQRIPAALKPAEMGGKAANVTRLAAIAGVTIPDSFVVTTRALTRFVHDAFPGERRAELVRAYLVDDAREPFFAALAHAPLPAEVREQILEHVAGQDLVIVRSSGTLEDSVDTSLAGHYESIVTPTTATELFLAIKTCWLVGLRVYFDHIFDGGSDDWDSILDCALSSLALVCQTVVNAEKSGVYFSQSPLHPGRALAVASWGTCHAVVDGKLASDTYVLDGSHAVERDIPYKFEMTVVAPRGDVIPGQKIATPCGETSFHFPYSDQIATARVPARLSGTPVLDERELAIMATTAEQIRAEVGYEIDMEWSFSSGGLVVLQVRPITTAPPAEAVVSTDAHYRIASPGVAQGPVKVVRSPRDIDKIEEGDLMAVQATDPDYMPIFYRVTGILSEDGSPLSHTAIVARELKIPCLTGVRGATSGLFREGELIVIDADHGRIERTAREIPAQTASVPTRNHIVYHVHHLPLARDRSVTLAVSGLLFGFLHHSNFADPTPERMRAYLDALEQKHNVDLSFHWDISDHDNNPRERDLVVTALARALGVV